MICLKCVKWQGSTFPASQSDTIRQITFLLLNVAPTLRAPCLLDVMYCCTAASYHCTAAMYCRTTACTCRYITPFSVAYLLFSIGVGYFKAWAMLGGLLGTKKSKSWKVRHMGLARDGWFAAHQFLVEREPE